LFNNVLEMARIDAGAVAKEDRWSYPSEIVSAAHDQVAQALKEHRVSLMIEPDTPVRLDARLAAAALAHLLENAAQYAPSGTSIDVSSEVAGTDLLLRVRDHGPGIADADLPHVFDRFFRGRSAAQTRASGTGMGLWIAKGLVAAVHGRIWVENCADGGARFTLALPLVASTAGKEPAAS
jgi:two-component system sensor histidine kinase KdpD